MGIVLQYDQKILTYFILYFSDLKAISHSKLYILSLCVLPIESMTSSGMLELHEHRQGLSKQLQHTQMCKVLLNYTYARS